MTDSTPIHDPSLPESLTAAGQIALRDMQIDLLRQENAVLRQHLDALQDGAEAQAAADWLGEIIPSDEGDFDNIFVMAGCNDAAEDPLVGLLRAIVARITADDAAGAIEVANSMIERLTQS